MASSWELCRVCNQAAIRASLQQTVVNALSASHSLKAVSLNMQVDNRMRAWYMQNMSVGLLYTCTLGDVRPDCPVALIQNRKHDGADFMEVIPMEHQMPAQREQVWPSSGHRLCSQHQCLLRASTL